MIKKTLVLALSLLFCFASMAIAQESENEAFMDKLIALYEVPNEFGVYKIKDIDNFKDKEDILKFFEGAKDVTFAYPRIVIGSLGEFNCYFVKEKDYQQGACDFDMPDPWANPFPYKIFYQVTPLKIYEDYNNNPVEANSKYSALLVAFIAKVKRVSPSPAGGQNIVVEFKTPMQQELSFVSSAESLPTKPGEMLYLATRIQRKEDGTLFVTSPPAHPIQIPLNLFPGAMEAAQKAGMTMPE